MSTVLGTGRRLGFHGLLFSHRFSLERQTVTVVHEPVENGVGQSRIGEIGVPLIDRQLNPLLRFKVETARER